MKNNVNKFVGIWFPPSERVLLTTIISLNIIFAAIIAAVLPGIIFDGYEPKYDDEDYA